ncbi:unnamed protein product [Rangifer tarandus platyrhynchus]|uniref:Uncharacterized protein n=1 Tax=Rangifer tarandus platyrhynchus TaxID=3082113 RepID=A0ABN8ZDQ6_RANTA|nr:unnamed protein product [Rangifer tarandus platyrhynchus]
MYFRFLSASLYLVGPACCGEGGGRLFAAEIRAREGKLSSSETLSQQPLLRPSLLSPVATTAWRRLPPPSRMVLLLAGLGPGSRPPLPPASELLLRVSPGGLPVTGREGLLHIQSYSSWDPTGHLNLRL